MKRNNRLALVEDLVTAVRDVGSKELSGKRHSCPFHRANFLSEVTFECLDRISKINMDHEYSPPCTCVTAQESVAEQRPIATPVP